MEHGVYRSIYEVQDSFWWYKGMRKMFDVLLARYLNSRKNRILDIGCGTGALFPVLERYGTVFGIDFSEEALNYARTRGSVEVTHGDAANLPYANGAFDVVVCSDLLYHSGVKNDAAVLSEIHRVLKPGGVFVLKEAAYDWLRSRMDELVHTRHRYTIFELRRKLAAASFTIERITYGMTLLFPLALIARLLERISPKSHGPEMLFTHHSLLNPVFTVILYTEAMLLRGFDFPFGLSIFAVARKAK